MIVQRPAQIFKAYNRNTTVSEKYQCFSTLSTNRKSLSGCVTVFDEEILIPRNKKKYITENDELVIIFPLIGVIEISDLEDLEPIVLIPEEIQVLQLRKGQSFSISIPYNKGVSNFLQIRVDDTSFSRKESFIYYEQNKLNLIMTAARSFCYFGVFDGRNEAVYLLQNKNNGVLVFVINGAFEIENRLLENKDAIFLWDTKKVELEALSENAIILLLEVPF